MKPSSSPPGVSAAPVAMPFTLTPVTRLSGAPECEHDEAGLRAPDEAERRIVLEVAGNDSVVADQFRGAGDVRSGVRSYRVGGSGTGAGRAAQEPE